MASEWNEAAARQRLSDYTDALEQVGNELRDRLPLQEGAVAETRARLEAWCWHDLRHAYAEIDRLRLKTAKATCDALRSG